jgi:hypothetical protein
MGLKTIHTVTAEVSTVDNTWTNLATYTVPSDCNIRVTEIFALGRATSGTVGEIAYGEATHRGKRVGGTLSLVGSIVFITTFNTGSDGTLKSCSLQLIATGNNLILQVRGIGSPSARNIDWYGGFTVTLN